MPRKPTKNPAAVALGRKGGSKRVPKGFAKSGKASEAGKAGAKKRWGAKWAEMTPEQRSEHMRRVRRGK